MASILINKNQIMPDPFFIFYDDRSGSTYLSKQLAQNNEICIPPETNFIPNLLLKYTDGKISNYSDLEKAIDLIFQDPKFSDWGISSDKIRSYVSSSLPVNLNAFIKLVFNIYKQENNETARLIGIKKNYLNYVDKVVKVFPDSKYIGLIRDGRAVFNSKKNSIYSVTNKPFETSPRKGARTWIKFLKDFDRLEEKLPSNSLRIYYEAFINSSLDTMEKVFNFLKVDSIVKDTEKQNQYSIPERYGDMHDNIYKEPLTTRISAWKKDLSGKEIFVYELISHKYLVKEGYELTNELSKFKTPLNKLHAKMRLF
ncbi:sulfotransferase [Thermodesulfobacteriota bacterium]